MLNIRALTQRDLAVQAQGLGRPCCSTTVRTSSDSPSVIVVPGPRPETRSAT